MGNICARKGAEEDLHCFVNNCLEPFENAHEHYLKHHPELYDLLLPDGDGEEKEDTEDVAVAEPKTGDFRCVLVSCGKKFANIEELKKHKEESHPELLERMITQRKSFTEETEKVAE